MEWVNYIIYGFLFVALYFEVFVLIAFLERVGAQKKKGEKMRLPKVAVIVPCYNEERTISATIRSLLALSYPREKLEILLVNDGSKDGSPAILDRFAKRYQHIRVFHKENGGKHTALNLALSKTGAELVGCLDADSFVAPDALKEAVTHFIHHPDVMAVTPAIKVANANSILGKIQQAEYGLSIFMRRVFAMTNSTFITPGPFSFFRRSVFEEIGYYRKAYHTEDLEIGLRLQEKKMRIDNAPTVHVFTTVPTSIRALYKQRVRWTYGFLKNIQDYRHMVGNYKYGVLGLVVLPSAITAIFGAIFFAGYMLWSAAEFMVSKVVEISTAGFSAGLPVTDFFYIQTQALLFISIALIALTLLLIFIGKGLASERRYVGLDIPLFILLYGFLAPLWLAGAVAKAAFVRDISWR